jgi:hypothetical protein
MMQPIWLKTLIEELNGQRPNSAPGDWRVAPWRG